ncbi:GL24403 [Drosophila persimilis]|uniref:GL24403 n=1 Tax=Drosophila persimilis TaxID=7234 RepID=B4G5P0_DROPE|nr:GL24403 [Drosophila persimilis]
MMNILRQRRLFLCPAQAAQRSLLHTSHCRPGYIVLVPEIGEEGHLGEGVLKPDGLPAFSDITIEMCLGAIGQQASAVEKSVKALEQEIKSGKRIDSAAIFGELDAVTGPLETTWGVAKALYLGNSTLIPTKSYMNIHERARNARAAKYCNKTVYNALLQQDGVAAAGVSEQRMRQKQKWSGSIDNLKQIFAKLLKIRGSRTKAWNSRSCNKFAKDSGCDYKLDAYDVSYWRRKQLVAEHNLQEEKLSEFFPLPRVISGLFSLSEKLFNIRIVEHPKAEVWHPAVKFYDVFDGDVSNGSTPVGGFYVDCFSKEHRFGRNNGWMVGIRNSNKSAGLTPLCALIFNFADPVQGKVPLLSYDDLQMMFKTFGSGLQHLLTQAGYSDLAGLSNIEWDASQVSGYVMSNFLDDPTVLRSLSGHYASDEPIDAALSQKMPLLKTQLGGYQLCQELYLADLDLELHRSNAFWLDIVRKLWPVYHCMPLDKKDAHPCSMTDIFSGDWAAAQFSHLYSKMIAADISSSFAAQRSDENYAAVGKRYKQTFLSSGGSVPTAEVFRRFLGRDPSVEALLKSLDIFAPSQTTENN